MKAIFIYMPALLALTGCASLDTAGTAQSKADAVLVASKTATGGRAWDKPGGCYEEGTRGDGKVSYKTWFSLNRYAMRVEGYDGGATRTQGFNGTASWRSGGDGKTVVQRDAAALQEAVMTAYLSNNGFFFPQRFPATFRYLREATETGRTYDLLEIAPEGGRAIEVWFDRNSHLIDRVIDSRGIPPVTVRATDYGKAGPYTIAYTLSVFGPDGSLLDRGRVTSFACDGVDDNLFEPPDDEMP